MGSMEGGQGKQDGEQKRLQTGNDMAGICVNGNGKRAARRPQTGYRAHIALCSNSGYSGCHDVKSTVKSVSSTRPSSSSTSILIP